MFRTVSSRKDNLVEWVHRGSDAKVQVIDTEVKDPTSYEEIKKALNIFYDKYFDEKTVQNTGLTLLLELLP